MPDLNWRHHGRRIVIPAAILRADDPTDLSFETASALVDTGATASGIMPRVIDALALQPHGKRLVKGAHNEAMADAFVFRIGQFPDQSGAAANAILPYLFGPIMGLRFSPSEYFDAIIGMDVLGQCDFSMTRNGNCRLAFG